eukprot:3515842-Rhodomonas_salina.7
MRNGSPRQYSTRGMRRPIGGRYLRMARLIVAISAWYNHIQYRTLHPKCVKQQSVPKNHILNA